MKEYCKIRADGSAQDMGNAVTLSFRNPTDAQRDAIAALDNWLEKQYTAEPAYDPETQYTTYVWVQNGNYAVQTWTVHDKPEPEPTIEERVDDLEGGMDALVGGAE